MEEASVTLVLPRLNQQMIWQIIPQEVDFLALKYVAFVTAIADYYYYLLSIALFSNLIARSKLYILLCVVAN